MHCFIQAGLDKKESIELMKKCQSKVGSSEGKLFNIKKVNYIMHLFMKSFLTFETEWKLLRKNPQSG